MKKKSILTWTSVALCSLALSSVIATTAVSCSSNDDVAAGEAIVQLNRQYADKKAALQNTLGLPKVDANNKLDVTGKALVENAQAAVQALKQYKEANQNLSDNEQIWLDSYIYNWETEINNWNNGLQYLGGNPSGGALPLNPNSNHLDENINSALNIYEIDDQTLEPIADDDHINVILASGYEQVGQDLIDYITALKAMLKAGMENGVMPNNITKKLFVNQMLNNYYPNELLYWVKHPTPASTGTPIALPVKPAETVTFVPTNAMLTNFNVWQKWAAANNISQTKIDATKTLLEKAQQTLDDFMNWYANEYYQAANSFGYVGNAITPLTVTSTQRTEERTISVMDDKKPVSIYGLGVTPEELNLNNVGLGFMKSSLKINDKAISGNDIYQALLQFNNSINKTATELVATGKDYVAQTTKNMHAVAQQVTQLNNPGTALTTVTWAPTVMYDNDIEDPQKPVNTVMNIYSNGQLNFAEFNKWLNQEDFFFGRETSFWSQTYGTTNQTNLEAYTSSATNDTFKTYLTTLTTLGYAGDKGIWSSQPTSPIYGAGSVSGQQALAGAVLSMVDYNNFKQTTADVYNYSFKAIPEYAVAPYNEKIQEVIGVGLEGPRGSNIFNYNVNPYFSLPKWSQSSFQTHEGKMGHHTQQAYWTKYMPEGDGSNGKGPGYVFKQDSFHEGWAVFTEWYANQLGVYGTELDKNALPTNWLKANGMVPTLSNTTAPTEADINAIKTFQAGVYWQAASGATTNNDQTKSNLTNDQVQAIAATKLANMLQYYGYLNEAQLRNMRLAVDPLYHYNGKTNDTAISYGDNQSINYGASINDVRAYLKANSGLGQGDIQSESFRYLNMPSQATGYMTGKAVFEELFNQVKKQYEGNNQSKAFLQDQQAVQKLFDLMLRNGEIPLNVLENAVKSAYNLK